MANSQPDDFVTLVSSDGFEFVIPRSTACVSGTIRRMLDSGSMLFLHLIYKYLYVILIFCFFLSR